MNFLSQASQAFDEIRVSLHGAYIFTDDRIGAMIAQQPGGLSAFVSEYAVYNVMSIHAESTFTLTRLDRKERNSPSDAVKLVFVVYGVLEFHMLDLSRILQEWVEQTTNDVDVCVYSTVSDETHLEALNMSFESYHEELQGSVKKPVEILIDSINMPILASPLRYTLLLGGNAPSSALHATASMDDSIDAESKEREQDLMADSLAKSVLASQLHAWLSIDQTSANTSVYSMGAASGEIADLLQAQLDDSKSTASSATRLYHNEGVKDDDAQQTHILLVDRSMDLSAVCQRGQTLMDYIHNVTADEFVEKLEAHTPGAQRLIDLQLAENSRNGVLRRLKLECSSDAVSTGCLQRCLGLVLPKSVEFLANTLARILKQRQLKLIKSTVSYTKSTEKRLLALQAALSTLVSIPELKDEYYGLWMLSMTIFLIYDSKSHLIHGKLASVEKVLRVTAGLFEQPAAPDQGVTIDLGLSSSLSDLLKGPTKGLCWDDLFRLVYIARLLTGLNKWPEQEVEKIRRLLIDASRRLKAPSRVLSKILGKNVSADKMRARKEEAVDMALSRLYASCAFTMAVINTRAVVEDATHTRTFLDCLVEGLVGGDAELQRRIEERVTSHSAESAAEMLGGLSSLTSMFGMLSGGSQTAEFTDAKNAKLFGSDVDRLIVFMVGGITASEVCALNAMNHKRLICASTNIATFESLCNDVILS